MIRHLVGFALVSLLAAPLFATQFELSIRTELIFLGKPVPQLVFAGEPLLADLTAKTAKGDPETLKGADWWKQLTWTVRDPRTGSIAGTLQVRDASGSPRAGGLLGSGFGAGKPPAVDVVHHVATVDLGQLPPGEYEIEATVGSLWGKDRILVSTGNETPEIRWFYLRKIALATNSWEEYQRIQLERACLIPERPWPFQELGHRATRDGTLAQATDYFNRAIALHEMILSPSGGKRSTSERIASEVTIGQLRAIRSLLPELFARRGELELFEYLDSKFRSQWALKDRRTGETVRVGDPKEPAAIR